MLPLLLLAWGTSGHVLSGTFAGEAVLDVGAGTVSFDCESEISAALNDWEATIETQIDASVWDMHIFELAWFGERWSFSSCLRLEPDADRLKDWKTEWTWSHDAWDVTLQHKLTRTRRWLSLDVEGALGDVKVDSRVRLRSSPCASSAFYDGDIEVSRSVCGIDASFEVAFDADGFDGAVLAIEDLALGSMPWLLLDIEMERDLEAVTVTLDPTIRCSTNACLEFKAEMLMTGGTLEPLRLISLRLEWDVSGIEIDGTVILDPDDWIKDTYSARLELEGEMQLPGGCEFETRLALYWQGSPSDGARLARASARTEVALSDDLSVSLSIDLCFDPAEPQFVSIGLERSW